MPTETDAYTVPPSDVIVLNGATGVLTFWHDGRVGLASQVELDGLTYTVDDPDLGPREYIGDGEHDPELKRMQARARRAGTQKAEPSTLELQVRRLDLHSGDTLVLECARPLSGGELEEMSGRLGQILGPNVPVLILDRGIRLAGILADAEADRARLRLDERTT